MGNSPDTKHCNKVFFAKKFPTDTGTSEWMCINLFGDLFTSV